MVLVVLAALWAWFLASWVRNASRSHRSRSLHAPHRHLAVLERTRPAGVADHGGHVRPLRSVAPPVAPPDPLVRPPRVDSLFAGRPGTRAEARKRRRDFALVMATAATLISAPAALLGGLFMVPAVVAWSIVAVYLGLMARADAVARHRYEQATWDELEGDWVEDEDWDDESWHDDSWDEAEAWEEETWEEAWEETWVDDDLVAVGADASDVDAWAAEWAEEYADEVDADEWDDDEGVEYEYEYVEAAADSEPVGHDDVIWLEERDHRPARQPVAVGDPAWDDDEIEYAEVVGFHQGARRPAVRYRSSSDPRREVPLRRTAP